ncbi:MAG TPA: 30S ribosomal protein S3 [Patescibacteria group bacterium]|jgi:small subunit ribosomal protein S3
MGQKVHPTNFRLGGIFSWKSRWFAKPEEYSDKVLEDYHLRDYFHKKLHNAGLVRVDIERSISKMRIVLHVSRPGVVIGKGGANLEEVKKEVEKLLNTSKVKKEQVHVDLKVEEVKNPDLSARLVTERIISQLIGRYPHRRAINQALEKVMAAGAKGIKIQLAGRIGGAEISRREKYFKGSIPTQTLRANIDYFEAPAKTRSGFVGIKVWIYKGEIV